jgi:hypothetical protein
MGNERGRGRDGWAAPTMSGDGDGPAGGRAR